MFYIGERLSSVELCQAGPGTYVRQGYVFASLAGLVAKDREKSSDLPLVSVKSKNKAQSVPEIGAIVTCKVCFTLWASMVYYPFSVHSNCYLIMHESKCAH